MMVMHDGRKSDLQVMQAVSHESLVLDGVSVCGVQHVDQSEEGPQHGTGCRQQILSKLTLRLHASV